jgi:hypothetical protein
MKALTIHHLVFTGVNVASAKLAFGRGVTLVWGASNTGKSFVQKSIDFMLGGHKALPSIQERVGYDTVWLGCSLTGVDDFTLSRAISGGVFRIHEGLVSSTNPFKPVRALSAEHDHETETNLSVFLLKHLGFDRKLVASSSFGKKESLSFRDLAKYVLIDETSIQAERSPVEGGQHKDRTADRSVFRLLVTGADDSALTEVMDDKTFKTSKEARIQVIKEMIALVQSELRTNYPDAETLAGEAERLTKGLEKLQTDLAAARAPVDTLLKEKAQLAREIPTLQSRISQIDVHLARFSKLDAIYESDIRRLNALEEAAFLVGLRASDPCPLCGTPAAVQHTHPADEVSRVREASAAEVKKVGKHRSELGLTVADLERERAMRMEELPVLQSRLEAVETEIDQLTPSLHEQGELVRELLQARDRVRRGLALLEQKESYERKRVEYEALRKTPKKDKPTLRMPAKALTDFCKVVTEVLAKWGFPSEGAVSFDTRTFDLLIDGKARSDNGKGVRAVTHAAFKVALLIYCRERGLPHPGLLVLDTPLLTYRDPLTNKKAGELTDDERALAQTPLKQKFFEHLSTIREYGQCIVLENVDPPQGVRVLSEAFLGHQDRGRFGFFPIGA